MIWGIDENRRGRYPRWPYQNLLQDGVDPGAKKKQDRIDAIAKRQQTFGMLADGYLERQQATGTAPSTITKTIWPLKNVAAPLRPRREPHETAQSSRHDRPNALHSHRRHHVKARGDIWVVRSVIAFENSLMQHSSQCLALRLSLYGQTC